MIKGSKPFLIITFLMSFGLAFYIANRAFPIFKSAASYVSTVASTHSKALPFADANGAVLEQIIAREPSTLQLVYKLPLTESYKVDADSIQADLQAKYHMPSEQVQKFLESAPTQVTLEYLFKDKNNTKLVSFNAKYPTVK